MLVSSLCLLRTCFCTVEGILHDKDSHSSCERRWFFIFNVTCFQDRKELLSKWLWSVSLCAFPAPAVRQGWLWLGVVFIGVRMCSLCPISVRTCAHGGGGTVSSSVQMKRTAWHLCWKSKDCYEYIISWFACQGVSEYSWLRESRLWGLIKPNSCWFVLVEQSEGEREGL